MQPIVVTGMHRSGTSLVTRILHQLIPQLHLPRDPYVAEDNPEGHGESRSVIALNEALLAWFGGTWMRPPLVAADAFAHAPARFLGPLARQRFDRVYESPWLAKDPRFCLTLPFWLGLWSEAPLIVIVLRHPRDVTASLLVRDNLPVPKGMALSAWYITNVLRSLRGHDAIAIQYRDIVASPESALRDLASWVSVAGGPDPSKERIKAARELIRPSGSAPTRHAVDEQGPEPWMRVAELRGPLSANPLTVAERLEDLAELRDQPFRLGHRAIRRLRAVRRLVHDRPPVAAA